MAAANPPFSDRYFLNMKRIGGLIALSQPSTGPQPPSPGTTLASGSVRAELRRAIVVFLHATFEDMLRTAARQRLASAGASVLNGIPMVGTSQSGRAEKFHLGALETHRGKTVDQLIRASVEEYLDRLSFSTCGDVDQILRQIGLETSPFKFLYADLDELMKRRHRIVHEADLVHPTEAESPTATWTFGDDFRMCIWHLTVMAMHYSLRMALEEDQTDREVSRFYLARTTRAIELARQTRMDLIAVAREPAEARVAGAQAAANKLTEVLECLGPPSNEEVLMIWRSVKNPDDETTEEAIRAELAASRPNHSLRVACEPNASDDLKTV